MKKVSNKKGFTLAELLIVVAIIAILVAIAIPVFGNALNKAKLATDAANVRAYLAEEIVNAMTADTYDDADNITVDATKVTLNNGTTLGGGTTAGAAVKVTRQGIETPVIIPVDNNVIVTVPTT